MLTIFFTFFGFRHVLHWNGYIYYFNKELAITIRFVLVIMMMPFIMMTLFMHLVTVNILSLLILFIRINRIFPTLPFTFLDHFILNPLFNFNFRAKCCLENDFGMNFFSTFIWIRPLFCKSWINEISNRVKHPNNYENNLCLILILNLRTCFLTSVANSSYR